MQEKLEKDFVGMQRKSRKVKIASSKGKWNFAVLNVVKPKFNGNFARTKKFFRYKHQLNKKDIFTLRSLK